MYFIYSSPPKLDFCTIPNCNTGASPVDLERHENVKVGVNSSNNVSNNNNNLVTSLMMLLAGFFLVQ
jgi:hypothetical protein